MPFRAPPAVAAWQHHRFRTGFEVVYLQAEESSCLVEGWTTAIEGGKPWMVSYRIELDEDWRTRHADVLGRSRFGPCLTVLEADGEGHWLVDGEVAPHLDGCLDVDLESSALTNALPVHRLGLFVGDSSPAPAAYVRALDLSVERLEQAYERLTDEGNHHRYDYAAPASDFTCRLVYDESGLVLDYPGIAVRSS